MKVNGGVKALVSLVAMAATGAFAFPPIPKESARALAVTRGKPFSSGMVFVNGKYVAPPYTVERWGTGIRINSIPVTGQVVDWNDFLKTQSDVRTETKEIAVQDVPAPMPQLVSVESEASALDDLFNNAPSAASARRTAVAPVPTPRAPAPPKTVVTYSLSGDFIPNADSKALLKRVNDARTEIDRVLRAGGFICFGDTYSRVTGDKRALKTMMRSLPEIQQRAESAEDFRARARAANLVYLSDALCEDLFKNRIDYRKIKERRDRENSDRQLERVLEEVSDPIL